MISKGTSWDEPRLNLIEFNIYFDLDLDLNLIYINLNISIIFVIKELVYENEQLKINLYVNKIKWL